MATRRPTKPAAKRSAAKKGAVRPRAVKAGGPEGENAVLAKIAAMPEPYRLIGERLHAVILAHAPVLTPRLWYGMPAYARDGNVVCFFRGADVLKERYMTLGFSDKANLDDGHLWPIAFALTQFTASEEAQIAVLLKRAVN